MDTSLNCIPGGSNWHNASSCVTGGSSDNDEIQKEQKNSSSQNFPWKVLALGLKLKMKNCANFS